MNDYPTKNIKSIRKKMEQLEILAKQLEEMMKICTCSKLLHDEMLQVQKDYAELVGVHRTMILEEKAPKLLEKRIIKIKRKRGRPRKVAA